MEELSTSIAPVVLGGGKRPFDDFDESLDLEHLRLLQSPFATHITYGVMRRLRFPWHRRSSAPPSQSEEVDFVRAKPTQIKPTDRTNFNLSAC